MTFVIAEAGVNHDGDVDAALRMVGVAKAAGADAIKFQTFRAEKLVTAEAPKADYQKATTGAAESQFDMLRKLELDAEAHRKLLACCSEAGIRFLSTPFDEGSADFLDDLGIGLFKMPSGEVTNLPFLRHVAAKGKPVILSTGMADLDEVGAAVEALRGAGCSDLTLLHCVTNYPADPADSNLSAMKTMAEAFATKVGWSDHTPGITVSLAAVALGATVIEKHFTLDKGRSGPDHAASLDPQELKALVAGIRVVESSLGDGRKAPVDSELPLRAVARRSLVALRPIAAGAEITAEDLGALRPGTGLPPSALERVLGCRAGRDIAAGTPLTEEMLA